MPIKNTMNKRDIVIYHKLLKDRVSLSDISKTMLITKNTLEKFTPDIMKKVNEDNSKARKKILDRHRPDKNKNDKDK